jgi:hypothetical protein
VNLELAEKVARAVLYEGFLLYPYRASSVKNQQRFNFGVLHPASFDTSEMQTQCLIEGAGAIVDIRVRYLQSDAEQEVQLTGLALPCSRNLAQGLAEVSVSSEAAAPNLQRLTVRVRNRSEAQPASREDALTESMVSTHTILTLNGAQFISQIDPPAEFAQAAAQCRNIGTYPVLAGTEGERDMMLSSPIILYDYPQIAPESQGDLFDSTEIDEILTLRIMTLSDAEKEEIRAGDPRARQILERSELMPPEHLMKLHGAVRGLKPARDERTLRIQGIEIRQGDLVHLRPRRSADIMDIALKGKLATVEAIEWDYEGRPHLAVVLEDDPGRDLGMLRQPGHRFFFGAEEVEPIR